MTELPISENPSFKHLEEQLRLLRWLKRAAPYLRFAIKQMGGDISDLDALSQLDALEQELAEMRSLPDRFNNLFADRGWILYGNLNLTVAKEAVAKCGSDGIDVAEQFLVDYYTEETINFQLQMMKAIKAFRPRYPLAQKALSDYQAERYHACIPIVLMIMDGMINEINPGKQGVFASGIDLTAWDSIAAHPNGLQRLIRLLTKMRTKTSLEPITIPFRNGILHGIDLVYDSELVAAKTWAALFALRDWALLAEKGQLKESPKPKISWGNIFFQIRQNSEMQKRVEEWKPRSIVVGKDILQTGERQDFLEGTPEYALVNALSLWRDRNYGHLAGCFLFSSSESMKKRAGATREVYASKQLKSFNIIQVADIAPSVTLIEVEISYVEDGQEIKNSKEFRLVNLDSDGYPIVRDYGGMWVISNWYL